MLTEFDGGHSRLQLDQFITLREGGTVWGMYRQAVRELSSRYDSLRMIYLETEEMELDLLDLLQQQPPTKDRRWEIQVTRKRSALEQAARSAKVVEREFRRFFAQACHLQGLLGEVTEEQRETLEVEYWVFKVRKRALLDMTCNRFISSSVMEQIWGLPGKYTKEILAEIGEGPAAVERSLLLAEGPELLNITGAELDVQEVVECLEQSQRLTLT